MTKQKKKIFHIVITGGPCGGKTSALSHIKKILNTRGVGCIVLPEAARKAIEVHGNPGDMSPDMLFHFQRAIANRIINQEKKAWTRARRMREDIVVIISDRGLADARAYMDHREFDSLMADLNTSTEEVLLCRYDAVIHMQTAAQGAEAFYAQDDERSESIEHARAIDEETLYAWLGAHKLSVIPNPPTGGFEQKLADLLSVIHKTIGLEESVEIERKWQVTENDFSHIEYVAVRMTQMYLNGHENERVRLVELGLAKRMIHTIKVPHPSGGMLEIEQTIDREEYEKLLATRGIRGKPIIKHRSFMVCANMIFELDNFVFPLKIKVLELEVPSYDTLFTLPKIALGQEVTGDPAYSNAEIARSGFNKAA